MRAIVIFLVLAGAGILTWLIVSKPGKKPEPVSQEALAVSKHSAAFNASVFTVLTRYDQLSENFVNWDSSAAQSAASQLVTSLDSLQLNELKKDSNAIFQTALMFIENMKGDAGYIATETAIRPQRETFNSLTDNLYQFLNTVDYDQQTLFLQECPMAFDDTKSALWLSEREEIRNPYLGLHHPTYGKGMLRCGETKTKIDHTPKSE